MGQKQSKDELLYQQVNSGNTQGIKALRNEGAGLEWTDSKGSTPLIIACSNLELYNVAKTLIELGANVNAYSPGRQAGTPLHHAAKAGLEQIVKLLLSHGANAIVMNDDYQTPLDIARAKGYSNVVRAIEEKVCLFSGWLRELHGPGLLEVLAPKLLSRKVWVVVLPCGSRNPRKQFRLEVAIYTGLQEARPRLIIPLWKAKLSEPNFHQPDPSAIISDVSRISKRWKKKRAIKSSQEAKSSRIRLAPAQANEKEQLKLFCDACKGISQVKHPAVTLSDHQPSTADPASVPPTSEDEELRMAINASLQYSQERPFHEDSYGLTSNQKESTSFANSTNQEQNWVKFDEPEAGSTGDPPHFMQNQNSLPPAVQTTYTNHSPAYTPSAPPIASAPMYDGPIHYPSVDTSYFDSYSPNLEGVPAGGNTKKEETGVCTICLDAQVEGACVPCGHMAGCMSCLNDIKSKNWGCPLCRTKIDHVMRIYAV